MNTKILQKCIDELNKETFSKDRVLGMLETLVEMQQVSVTGTGTQTIGIVKSAPLPLVEEREVDEAEMLTKLAEARLKEVQEASQVEIVTQK